MTRRPPPWIWRRASCREASQVHLSQTELKLLATLARHADRLVTANALLKETWGPAYQRRQGYVRVYMHALRRSWSPIRCAQSICSMGRAAATG